MHKDKVYIFAGGQSYSGLTNDMWSLDLSNYIHLACLLLLLANLHWQKIACEIRPNPRSSVAAEVSTDGLIYFVGE